MPTYEYACKSCGHRFEIVQSFSDDALTACPECSGSLKKIFGNVGITFKGSGFYKTDSRSGSGAKSGSSESTSSGSSTSSSEGGSSSSSGSEKSDKAASGSSSNGHSHSHGAHSHTH